MDFKTILALFLQALLAYRSSRQNPAGTTQAVATPSGASTDYDSATALITVIQALQAAPSKP